MTYAHFAIGEAQSSHQGSHHELVVIFGRLAGFVAKKDLPAEMKRLVAVREAEGVIAYAVVRFDAVDVSVHACIEPPVPGHRGDELRIEDHLVKNRPVALEAQL